MRFINKVTLFIMVLFAYVVCAQQSYMPDEALRNVIRKEVWQKLKPETPKKQRFFTGLTFGSNECFKLYEKAANQRNWKPYELATIASFYKIILEETIAGRDYSEDEIKKIYQDTRKEYAMLSRPDKVSNSQIQKVYDQLIIEAIWVGTVFELAKNNSPEIQKKAQDLLAGFVIKTLIDSKNSLDGNEISEVESPTIATTTKPLPTNEPVQQPRNTSNEVEDIILRTVTSYGLGGVYVKNEVSVLFKNGTILTNPSVPLSQLNVTQSKRNQPKKWGTWKKQGTVLWVTKPWKNKTYDWKKWFKLRSGNQQTKLIGRFKSSDAFGGSKVINANNVSFDGQGRFAWKTIKGGNTVWKPVYSKSNSSGTYVINDYTITLNYNNGTSESFFFGFYPKDNEHFVIGSNHFLPLKK